MKKPLLLCLLLAAVVCGCNKEKKTEKEIYGYYTLKSYTVDGMDSLSSFKDSLNTDFNFFYDDRQNENACQISAGKDQIGWSWVLANGYKNLSVNIAYGWTNGTGPFGINKTPEWEIINLTDKEFDLKTNFNSKEYQIELERN